MKRAAAIALCVSLSTVAADSAQASTLVAMDLDALAANADVIFVGTVDDVASHAVEPGGRRIVTDVTLRSERDLLGAPAGRPFVVRCLGGEIGRVGQHVFGEASYSVGERVLVFAVARQSSYYTLGMAQGALHVRADAAGVPRVQTHLDGAMLIGPARARSADGRPLDDVVAQVRSSVARRRK
jgi:hypothetical protein